MVGGAQVGANHWPGRRGAQSDQLRSWKSDLSCQLISIAIPSFIHHSLTHKYFVIPLIHPLSPNSFS